MDGIMQNKLFATRQGTILLGVAAAVIAAIALIVYLNQYRNSVNNSATVPVLTAKGLIEKGTSGNIIASDALSRAKPWTKSEVKTGAITDPAELNGQVAVRDINPGQQLTAADFSPGTGSVSEKLSPSQRAVVIPLGSPQQVGGQIGGGSHVDVWVQYHTGSTEAKPIAKLLFQDVYVLGVSGGNVTLRLTPRQAGQVIFASWNNQIWLDLRPTIAKNVPQTLVTGTGG